MPLTPAGTPFFGIGAMRAGTTWLSEVLETRPDCRLAPLKELHFFDVRYGRFNGARYYRLKAERLAKLGSIAAKRMRAFLDSAEGDDSALATAEQVAESHSSAWSDDFRAKFFADAQLGEIVPQMTNVVDAFSIRDVDSYVRYLYRNTVGASAFGEITPAYGLLPAEAFAEMDRTLPGAIFIFIMRDPVDRLWSHARYRAQNAERRRGKRLDPSSIFQKALKTRGEIGRSDYHLTISELEHVIPPDRILYLFFETMTAPDAGPSEIRRVEKALGLNRAEIDPGIFSRPVNASPSAELDSEQEATALELFTPVYEFVEKRFGRQPGWRSI
jgi:hypothetical protein